jgi:hypothetical protein
MVARPVGALPPPIAGPVTTLPADAAAALVAPSAMAERVRPALPVPDLRLTWIGWRRSHSPLWSLLQPPSGNLERGRSNDRQ